MIEDRRSGRAAIAVGSITHLPEGDMQAHVCTGSHGGIAVGKYALFRRVRSLICHDAGVGKDAAGIRSLEFLDTYALAAAAVDHQTARIGDCDDMIARGVISYANHTASDCGVSPGMTCAQAFETLQRRAPAQNSPARIEPETFGRTAIPVPSGGPVYALDSASSIIDADAGRIIVTGSHGGLPGAARGNAIKARVRLAAFNDAGVGIDDAGIERLAALDEIDVAGVTVDCQSARIGEGMSTYETGVVSHVNDHARALGAAVGTPLRDVVEQVLP